MDAALTQTVAAGMIVLGATFFLGRRAWRAALALRRAKKQGACASGACGCGDLAGDGALDGKSPRP
jgi:hypothetical protein